MRGLKNGGNTMFTCLLGGIGEVSLFVDGLVVMEVSVGSCVIHCLVS